MSSLYRNESDYTIETLTSLYKYNFNFCSYAKNPCGETDKAYAFQKSKIQGLFAGTCKALTDDDITPDLARSIPSTNTSTSAGFDYTPARLEYTISGGSDCGQGQASLSFVLTCNKNVSGEPNFKLNEDDKCHPIISFEHKTGCSVTGDYSSFLERNPWVIALLFIIFGPIMNFKGRKFVPWVIGIVSGGATFFVLVFFFNYVGLLDWYYYSDGNGTAAAVSTLVIIVASFLVGYCMKTKLLMLGFMVLGGVAGFFVGGIFFNLVMVEWASSLWAFIGTLFFFILLGIILGYKLKDSVVIISTAFIGSYLFVRGISLFTGGYPSEKDLIKDLEDGNANFTPTMIGFLVAMGIMVVCGILYQRKQQKIEDGEGDDDGYKKA